jgi:hypothetical protein
MASKLPSRRDVESLLHQWLDVASLWQRPRVADHSRASLDSTLVMRDDRF